MQFEVLGTVTRRYRLSDDPTPTPARAELRRQRERQERRRRRRPGPVLWINVALLTAVGALVAFVLVPGGGSDPTATRTSVALTSQTQAVATTMALNDSVVKATGSAAAAASGGASSSAATAAARTDALPFDMPSTGTLRGSGRKVFAHYMPTLPISIDNRPPAADYYESAYLNPTGEGGKHRAYGGFLRDRPLPRAPIGGDYRLSDMRTEISQATSAGIDGFALDLMTTNRSAPAYVASERMMKAATGTGFRVLLTPDMSALRGQSAANVAGVVAAMAKYSSAYRLGDGRLAVSPFQAEAVTPDYWKTFISTMKSQYGTTVALVPVFINETTALPTYSSIIYGSGNWGFRYPTGNSPDRTDTGSALGRATRAMSSTGKLWFQPVSGQDERPVKGVFEEAGATKNLRWSWQVAIASGAQWVNMVTWNDYSEGSQLAPSQKRNWVNLDLSAYYLARFKTGATPKIVRDTVYVSHRTQPYAARPSFPQTKLMKLARGMAPVDTVEAVGFLTKPGTITVTSGGRSASCAVPAGVQTCTVSLAAGTVTARITRSSTTAASVTSPWKVTNSPVVQDLQYVSASSGRTSSGAVARTSAATATTAGLETTTTAAKSAAPRTKPAINSPAVLGARSAPNSVPVGDASPRQLEALKADGSTAALAAGGAKRSAYTSYVSFDVPRTPAGKRLATAALTIHTLATPAAGSVDQQVVRFTTGRAPGKLTPGNRAVGVLKGKKGPDATYTIVLDPAALATVDGTRQTFAVSGKGADTLWFWSRHSPSPQSAPTLKLTYR